MENKLENNIFYLYHSKRLKKFRIIFGILFSISLILTLVFLFLRTKSIVVTTKDIYGYTYDEYTYLESYKVYNILMIVFLIVTAFFGIIFSLFIMCRVRKVFTHNTEVIIYIGFIRRFLYLNDTLIDSKRYILINHCVLSATLQDGVLMTVYIYSALRYHTRIDITFTDDTSDIYL